MLFGMFLRGNTLTFSNKYGEQIWSNGIDFFDKGQFMFTFGKSTCGLDWVDGGLQRKTRFKGSWRQNRNTYRNTFTDTFTNIFTNMFTNIFTNTLTNT